MLRPAVESRLLAGFSIQLEPEFGRDHNLLTKWSQGIANQFFVNERPIYLGRIEERHTEFHGLADHRDHLLPILRGTVTEAHSHAAKSDRGDFQPAFSEFAFLHCSPPS